MFLRILLLLAVASLIIPAMAVSAEPGQSKAVARSGIFRGDEDKDGRLSKVEYLNMQAARFDAMDSDKDGSLTHAEKKDYDTAQKKLREARKKAQAKNSGKAAPEEKSFLTRFFN